MKTQATRVLLADDHVLYRESLRGLLERWDEFEVVGEASTGVEAVELSKELKPDIVLMDISMPEIDGLEALTAISEQEEGIAIVMLSAELTEEHLIRSFRNGARGYLLKNIHGSQLRAKLADALRGDIVLSSDVIVLCLDLMRAKHDGSHADEWLSEALATLAEQERQILRLVALGESNKEIGERLGIGESTVKKRFSLILAKLGLENRVQAAVFALQAGLLR